MQILRDIQAIQAMPAGELRGLIQQSAVQLLSQFEPWEYALEELGRYLVVEPGDALAVIDQALGFAILNNRWDGTRWCDAGFTPSGEIAEAHPGWFELVYMQGQDGSGVQLYEANNARERFLTVDETQRLHAALATSENVQLKHIVALLLLMGNRKRELLEARWSDFDLERRSWRIPLAKSGKARYVPLSAAALDVLGQLPRFEGCPYGVPNPKTLKP